MPSSSRQTGNPFCLRFSSLNAYVLCVCRVSRAIHLKERYDWTDARIDSEGRFFSPSETCCLESSFSYRVLFEEGRGGPKLENHRIEPSRSGLSPSFFLHCAENARLLPFFFCFNFEISTLKALSYTSWLPLFRTSSRTFVGLPSSFSFVRDETRRGFAILGPELRHVIRSAVDLFFLFSREYFLSRKHAKAFPATGKRVKVNARARLPEGTVAEDSLLLSLEDNRLRPLLLATVKTSAFASAKSGTRVTLRSQIKKKKISPL